MIIKKVPKILSISVMAHPSREKFFPYLKKKLGESVPFSIDHNSEGVWPNAKKAWAMALDGEQALYHVVIQDDAVVCDNFLERAEGVVRDAIRRCKTSEIAISFYFGKRGNLTDESKKALERGFATRQSPTWGVAICLPVSHIAPMIEYGNRFNVPQDDYRIGMYLKKKGIRVYFPMPSLIDHRTSLETPSLVGDPGKFRCAYAFIDDPAMTYGSADERPPLRTELEEPKIEYIQ